MILEGMTDEQVKHCMTVRIGYGIVSGIGMDKNYRVIQTADRLDYMLGWDKEKVLRWIKKRPELMEVCK